MQDAATEITRKTIVDIASELQPANRMRFYSLSQAESLSKEEARELAELLAGLAGADDEGVRDDAPSADDLLAAAQAFSEPEPDLNVVTTATPGVGGAPEAAGVIGDVLKALDPRNLVKPFGSMKMS